MCSWLTTVAGCYRLSNRRATHQETLIAHLPLLAEHLVRPLDEANQCGRICECRVLAGKIGFEDPTGP